jgi:hypothetical protein
VVIVTTPSVTVWAEHERRRRGLRASGWRLRERGEQREDEHRQAKRATA